ncbi:MAG: coiled coil domain-containing protein [Deltaproteobacteria bacterium]|nr:coiled coil domain-containing protein [Deltaproteobacteria bacterium]
METRKSYHDRKEELFRELDSRIEVLKKAFDQSRSEVKLKYREQIETLRKKQETLGVRLRELKDAGEDRWEGLKDGVEGAYEDLRKYFDGLAGRFRR